MNREQWQLLRQLLTHNLLKCLNDTLDAIESGQVPFEALRQLGPYMFSEAMPSPHQTSMYATPNGDTSSQPCKDVVQNSTSASHTCKDVVQNKTDAFLQCKDVVQNKTSASQMREDVVHKNTSASQMREDVVHKNTSASHHRKYVVRNHLLSSRQRKDVVHKNTSASQMREDVVHKNTSASQTGKDNDWRTKVFFQPHELHRKDGSFMPESAVLHLNLVLAYIEAHPGVWSKDIAAATGMKRSALSHVLYALRHRYNRITQERSGWGWHIIKTKE